MRTFLKILYSITLVKKIKMNVFLDEYDISKLNQDAVNNLNRFIVMIVKQK